MGARLAEMARIRLQYDETRQQVQDIQQVIKKKTAEILEKTNFQYSSIIAYSNKKEVGNKYILRLQ